MTLNDRPLTVGDKVMVAPCPYFLAETDYGLKEGLIAAIDAHPNGTIALVTFFCDGTNWWISVDKLLRMGAPVRDIIHRERIMDMSAHGSYDPKLLEPVDIAYARGVSWIKRNLREWPYGYELACEATTVELLFWFQKVED